jgi:fibronectin-binding autotransporter adhesin
MKAGPSIDALLKKRALRAVAIVLTLGPAIASAQVIWDNSTGDNAWGTGANWSSNTVPTAGSNVQFNANETDTVVNNISLGAMNRNANMLTFNSVNDNFSITGVGRTLTLASGDITRTAGSSGTQVLAFTTLALGGASAMNIAGTGSLEIQSAMTGSVGVTKSGAGELILSGANTFTGATVVSAGTLTLANSSAMGATGTWGNSVASGATLALRGGITVNEGGLDVVGTGVGGTSGALRNVSDNNTLGAQITMTGATSITSASGTLTLSNTVGANFNVTTSGAGNVTFSGAVNGGGGFTHNGTGTLSFTGTAANSFSGALAINDGTVALGKTAGTTAIASNTITVGNSSGAAGSAVLRLDASNQISDSSALTINSDGRLDVNTRTESINALASTGQIFIDAGGKLTVGINSGNISLGGSILGNGTLMKDGAGTLSLLSSIVMAGELQLDGGNVALNGFELTAGTLHVTENTTIDFGGGNSTISFTNLIVDADSILTIQNWSDAADFFYTAGWAGATPDATGDPMSRVVFQGWTGSNTKWQSFDDQVTPVPEPSTYGAFLVGILGAAGAFRRWRRQRR